MILVAGTRRSGTSMWMQILRAAGHPVVGEALPRHWESLSAANPRGFFESSLRLGINFTTEADPIADVRLEPAETRRTAVKVFHSGVPRTERRWIDRMLVTVRDWRGYCRSVLRMEALERASAPASTRAQPRFDPAAEWLLENLLTLQDADERGYPSRFIARDAVLDDPATTVRAALEWLGGEHDAEAAVAAVQPALATREAVSPAWVAPGDAEIYDSFYTAVREGTPFAATEAMAALAGRIRAAPARYRAPYGHYERGLERGPGG